MKPLVIALLALAACKSKDKTEPAPAGSAAAAPKPDEPAAAVKGLTVQHQVPEFSGAYDAVFAQVSDADHQTVIAFVRGCPALTCDPGPWETEAVAHTCPKAFIATAKIPSLAAGKYTVDLAFAGPVENVSTATLEAVRIELTKVDANEGVEGSVSQKTTESSANGTFAAKVCPRT
jgi:hypothetical protein